MSPWSDDLTVFTLEQLLISQVENRAWRKDLRLQTTALINSRLAKSISRDQYVENRKTYGESEAECERRARRLVDEISGRYASPAARRAPARDS